VITALLVVSLLSAREAVRLTRGNTAVVHVIDRLLLPPAIGLGLVLAMRVVGLVIQGA
jgi:hypothetical protein